MIFIIIKQIFFNELNSKISLYFMIDIRLIIPGLQGTQSKKDLTMMAV